MKNIPFTPIPGEEGAASKMRSLVIEPAEKIHALLAESRRSGARDDADIDRLRTTRSPDDKSAVDMLISKEATKSIRVHYDQRLNEQFGPIFALIGAIRTELVAEYITRLDVVAEELEARTWSLLAGLFSEAYYDCVKGSPEVPDVRAGRVVNLILTESDWGHRVRVLRFEIGTIETENSEPVARRLLGWSASVRILAADWERFQKRAERTANAAAA